MKNDNFKKIAKFSSEYTDIIRMVKNVQEIQKIKYTVFGKKQLAVFNYLEDPYYPGSYRAFTSYMNKYMLFELDSNQLRKKALEFLEKSEVQQFKQDPINKRLHKFLGFN